MNRLIKKYKYMPALLIVVLVFSACQPTPDENYVVSRIDDKIYENSQSTMTVIEETANEYGWKWKELNYSDSFQGADERVLAEIDITDGKYLDGTVPVLRVLHHDYTAEDLKTAAQVLMPAEKYYDPTKLIEKETMQAWIDDVNKSITKARYNSELDKEDKDRAIAAAEEDIVYYTELMKQIGEQPDAAETDWQMKKIGEDYYTLRRDRTVEEAGSAYELRIREERREDGTFGFMDFTTISNDTFRANEMEFCLADRYAKSGSCYGIKNREDATNTMSVEQAQQMARGKLEEIGLDMHPVSMTGGKNGIKLIYYPTYMGLDYITMQKQSEYVEDHTPEWLYIMLHGDQIDYLKRINAQDVMIENSELTMITKEEALANLKKYIQIVYTGDSSIANATTLAPEIIETATNVRLEINDMHFGYVRIPIEDNPREFRLVPSWVFYGNVYLKFDETTRKELEEELFWDFRGTDEMCVFGSSNPGVSDGHIMMVINAVDGSYIEHQAEIFE